MTVDRGHIAIAGAGLGGLTAALALLRAGWHVRVYEQAPVLEEVGAGISLSSGAGRGLESLGIGRQLLTASLPCPDVAFVHYRTGALLAGTLDRGVPADLGFDTPRHIHRADLHAILLAAVRAADPDAVITGRQVRSVDQDDSGVTLHFTDGAPTRSDLLVAADGTRSAVRRQLFDDSAPVFAGQIAFRCLIPKDIASPFIGAGNAAVSIGAARIFHRYAVRHGTLINAIGIAKTDTWGEEGWNIPATRAEFLDVFADFHSDVRGLIGCAPLEKLIKWGLFVRPPIDNWRNGRVVLLGDAAHPILPFLGLGAALAMEDGVVLARALDVAPDHASAFAAYQAARVDRVENVRINTIRQGEIIQATDPDQGGLTHSPSQNVALFDYDPTKVKVTLHV